MSNLNVKRRLVRVIFHTRPNMEEGITLGGYYFIPTVTWCSNRINMSTTILCEAFYVHSLWDRYRYRYRINVKFHFFDIYPFDIYLKITLVRHPKM